jgi:hypothetical protein
MISEKSSLPYQVKRYDISENTWELSENLKNCIKHFNTLREEGDKIKLLKVV